MAVRDLRSQEAENDADVIVRSLDRQTMQAEYQGRTLDFAVDRALGVYAIHLPTAPVWNDGTPVSDRARALVKDAITEILRHWNTRAEFLDDHPRL